MRPVRIEFGVHFTSEPSGGTLDEAVALFETVACKCRMRVTVARGFKVQNLSMVAVVAGESLERARDCGRLPCRKCLRASKRQAYGLPEAFIARLPRFLPLLCAAHGMDSWPGSSTHAVPSLKKGRPRKEDSDKTPLEGRETHPIVDHGSLTAANLHRVDKRLEWSVLTQDSAGTWSYYF